MEKKLNCNGSQIIKEISIKLREYETLLEDIRSFLKAPTPILHPHRYYYFRKRTFVAGSMSARKYITEADSVVNIIMIIFQGYRLFDKNIINV